MPIQFVHHLPPRTERPSKFAALLTFDDIRALKRTPRTWAHIPNPHANPASKQPNQAALAWLRTTYPDLTFTDRAGRIFTTYIPPKEK